MFFNTFLTLLLSLLTAIMMSSMLNPSGCALSKALISGVELVLMFCLFCGDLAEGFSSQTGASSIQRTSSESPSRSHLLGVCCFGTCHTV